jgi:hypothetical protein
VVVPGRTELREIARSIGVASDEIRALNPHFIRGMTPPGRYSDVRVPPGTGTTLATHQTD